VTHWNLPDATHAMPPTEGHTVLADGTYVRVAGRTNSAGDPINETFTWKGHTVSVDAIGVVAVRFGTDGKVSAMAAGGLKSFKTDGFEIALPERVDIAFIKKPNGKARGVLQGLTGDVPATLLALTPKWQRLAVPPLLPSKIESH